MRERSKVLVEACLFVAIVLFPDLVVIILQILQFVKLVEKVILVIN